jgi:hypothetical protein
MYEFEARQMERIGELTIDELEAIVARMIDARLGIGDQPQSIGQRTPEVWEAIRTQVVKPSSDTPSPTALLREERDQWYKPTS